MAAAHAIITFSGDENQVWIPTTLDQIDKSEDFLEQALATCPKLMGLESRRSGIRGPFKVFRQLLLDTPSERTIRPDLVLFATSGHVIVVEVKRHANPELRNRAVIAQIIDYASSFASLNEDQAKELFRGERRSAETWPDLIQSLFPDEPNIDELAAVLLGRMLKGELNLVIACDKIPVGLPDVVAGIASQETLGFDLDLVEITPYVKQVSNTADIVFVPSTRLQTEIVARTAVTVTYREGDTQPSTSVQTTSIESVKKSIDDANRRPPVTARPDRLEYWEAFCEYLRENAPDVMPMRVTDAASLDVCLEDTGITLKVFMYGKPTDCLGVRFKDRNNVIESLPEKNLDEIEKSIGHRFGPGKKLKKKKANAKMDGERGPLGIQKVREEGIDDRTKWPAQHRWLLDSIRELDNAIAPHINAL